jgi:hypothetical protein
VKRKIRPKHKTGQKEIVDDNLYGYLLEFKIPAPVTLDDPYEGSDIFLAVRLYWTEGMSPVQISQLVNYSVREIVEVVLVLQSMVEAIIENYAKTKKQKFAIRQYFYERKPISQIARDLDITYSKAYRSIRKVIEGAGQKNFDLSEYTTKIEGVLKK